jgi:hypothetical protein
VSNMPFRFARPTSIGIFKGSPAHVSTLSSPATRAGIRPVPHRPAIRRRQHHGRESRCLSAVGIRLLSILFPPRSSAPLTIGLPGPKTRTPTGLPRSACARHGRGGRPLYPETSGVRTTGLWPPIAACRLLQRPGPPTRFPIPSARASNNEASSRVHSRSPVRPSPRPVAPPDGTEALGLLP